jgi:hypothetical protein
MILDPLDECVSWYLARMNFRSAQEFMGEQLV